MTGDDIYHHIDNIKNKDVRSHEHDKNLYRRMPMIDNSRSHHHQIILEHQLQLISIILNTMRKRFTNFITEKFLLQTVNKLQK